MKRNLVFIVLVVGFMFVAASEECPHGLVNDAYPGDCGRYVDSDGDALCDYSQEEEPQLDSREYKTKQAVVLSESENASSEGV